MTKPIAVLISDIHYSLPTLELADVAMRQAVTRSNELLVPLIVAGDLHDTKANLRGECVNRMLETFNKAKDDVFFIVGNHDRLNEKAPEHALNFLDNDYPTRFIVDVPIVRAGPKGIILLPYYHDPAELRSALKDIPKGSTIIMHQGIEGSNSGDYIQDKSAIHLEDVAGMRVISGHYHTRQTIKLPEGGTWDYIGNPYTLNYGEANDPPKGFQILMSDGSLEFVPTNLRKHVVIEYAQNRINGGYAHFETIPNRRRGDLIWVKAKGSRLWLNTLTKTWLNDEIGDLGTDFKLTLEPTDLDINMTQLERLNGSQLFDSLIDSTDTNQETKARLKTTWKSLCES